MWFFHITPFCFAQLIARHGEEEEKGDNQSRRMGKNAVIQSGLGGVMGR